MREKNINVGEKHQLVASPMCPNWGSNPDWELNLQPFGIRDDTPASRATWQGLVHSLCFQKQ